jgi:hypothetical protein
MPVTAFERTNFFYGLLLDAERLRDDHRFFNGKRALVNRLTIGSGVACGLGVRTVAGPTRQWFIDPGAAFDPLGREIVVPETFPFDASQPTDDAGRPAGDPLNSGVVEVCLAYKEVPIDPVPVLVPDCDGEGDCAPATIREGFAVVVRAAAAAAAPAGCGLPTIPVPPAQGLHPLIAARVGATPLQPPADALVPIARIDLAAASIDVEAGRPLIYSNRILYELIVCLAQHVAAAASRVLRYVSGDGQSGPAGTDLAQPLEVALTDAQNNPVAGEAVAFTVSAGGGSVAAASVVTAADGRASTTWKMGPAGPQEVTVTAGDTSFAVIFHSTSV